MLIISKGIETDSIIQEIDTLAIRRGHKPSTRRNGVAVLTVGNYLIAVSGRTIERKRFKYDNDDEEKGISFWKELTDSFIVKRFAEFCRYSPHVAEETSGNVNDSTYDPHVVEERAKKIAAVYSARKPRRRHFKKAKKEISAEFVKRFNRTPEQAVKAELERLRIADVPPQATPVKQTPIEPAASVATIAAQSPVPDTRLTRDQKIALAGLCFGILTCIAACLVVPQVQGAIQFLLHGATPTLTPTLSLPTATP